VSARAARRFLASLLMSWRMPELLEGDAALLLSELATNAVMHAQSAFTVVVRYDGSTLRVEVGDESHAQPRLRRPRAHDGAGGRGLMLVDTLSVAWGVVATPSGKRVWFELPAPART
jgi:anti-sigma regulatory factor (Ser/Thr protein kinase)